MKNGWVGFLGAALVMVAGIVMILAGKMLAGILICIAGIASIVLKLYMRRKFPAGDKHS
jgi:hypothetical protein